jgi:hypothetical protein
MIDHEGISGHQKFINEVITRLAAAGDVDEEQVQLFSLRENLLYEDRALAATLLNSAIHHLKMSQRSKWNEEAHRMQAIQSLNKAILQLPQVAT